MVKILQCFIIVIGIEFNLSVAHRTLDNYFPLEIHMLVMLNFLQSNTLFDLYSSPPFVVAG